MALEVSKVTRSYLGRRSARDDIERTVTFSIRLTEGQHAKLKFLAKRFGAPKTPVAQKLLNAAMDEALRTLAAHDAIPPDKEILIPEDEQLAIIDSQVDKYYEEIRRIFEEEASDEEAS